MKTFRITTNEIHDTLGGYETINIRAEHVELKDSESLIFRDEDNSIIAIYKKDSWRSVERILNDKEI